ncbi:MAG: class I SAM-dependent methyltransferase [Myxococcota bacterium]
MKSSGRAASRKSPPRVRRVGPAEPLAAALLDHHRDGRPRRVTALRADGVEFEIETEEYFTLDGELAPLDRLALARARGRVLDVGAGSGRHALALQAKGCEVVAIDVSPACVELCRERGIRDARVVDVMTIGAQDDRGLGRFDTIFFGMQTIGVAGGVRPLRILLSRLRGLLAPGGIVLADSSELREAWDGDAADRSPARGEIVLETRYGRLRGEPFPWVYLAEPDLVAVAEAAGYVAETLMRVESGEYLLELRAATATPDRGGAADR